MHKHIYYLKNPRKSDSAAIRGPVVGAVRQRRAFQIRIAATHVVSSAERKNYAPAGNTRRSHYVLVKHHEIRRRRTRDNTPFYLCNFRNTHLRGGKFLLSKLAANRPR